MYVKRLLILVPLAVIVLLLQSYFWVPTFDNQAKGSDQRLFQFINGSIGDAQILNPILHSDASSSTITGLIFEGLIDRDRDLSFRGRLATSWRIYEEAYFTPRPGGASPDALRKRILSARTEKTAKWLKNIEKVEAIPPADDNISVFLPPKQGTRRRQRKQIKVSYPARLKITLKSVDQNLFARLKKLLGPEAIATDPAPYLPADLDESTRRAAREKVKLIEHNPVIIFSLRKGVLFHDGHEFDSGDVRFTYESIMNSKNLSPRIPDYEPIKKVETPDEFTFKVTYKRLYSPAFGTWAMGMLPEHLLNDKALEAEASRLGRDPATFTMRDSSFNRSPVGVGPFKFKEWRSDELIRLSRNSDYWEGPPEYAEYIYRVIPDPISQEVAFYAGTIDSYGAGTHQVNRLKKDKRFQVFSDLSFGYTYIGYNMRREPFKDPRVRKALGMAINTRQIHRFVLNGQAEDLTGPFVKQSDHYNRAVKPLPYDPKGAERLLHEAGWRKKNGRLTKNGEALSFQLLTNHGNVDRKAIAVVVQDAWKKIGVQARVDTVEWAVFIKKYIHELNFDAVILGWSLGLDPDLYQIWHSSQTNPGQLNFVGYKNPEADKLIVKIRQEYDHQKQVGYAHRLHRIIFEDQPYTFLYVGKWTALLDRKIARVQRLPGGRTRVKKITTTKTGNYFFDFNQWMKFPSTPRFES